MTKLPSGTAAGYRNYPKASEPNAKPDMAPTESWWLTPNLSRSEFMAKCYEKAPRMAKPQCLTVNSRGILTPD